MSEFLFIYKIILGIVLGVIVIVLLGTKLIDFVQKFINPEKYGKFNKFEVFITSSLAFIVGFIIFI